MSNKIGSEPQLDQGTYSLDRNGTIHYTWQHWSVGQHQCGRLFATQNAYIFVECNNVFHTVYLKENILLGNQAK